MREHLEVYRDTAIFGPHQWMIRGSSNRRISEAQFTSEHDAKTAIAIGYLIGEQAKEELADRIRSALP